jgi:hypothetical protein
MALLALAGSAAGGAAADPANGFVIHLSCSNGKTVDMVSIAQAQNTGFQVVGSTSVVVVVGLTGYDLNGDLVVDYLRPGHQNQQLTACTFVAPGFGSGTAEVLYTPIGA